MSNHSNGNSSSADDTLIIFLVVIAILFAIVYFSFPILKEFLLTVKMWQMQIIALIHPSAENLQILKNLKEIPSYNWTTAQMMEAGNKANYYLLPFFLIFVYITSVVLKKQAYQVWRHGKSYSPKELLMQEKKVWKYLEPIAHLNLLQQDPTEGEWASAKKPQEIALEYKLLDDKNDNESLNKEKALKYFSSQLGNLYTGADNMPIALKALAGCFMSAIISKSLPKEELEKPENQYLNFESKFAFLDIAESFGKDAKGNVNFEPGLALFEKYKSYPKIKKMIHQHAYIYTVMARLFDETKKTGVVTTKYFIWLKPYDRRLYYMLNSIGREVSWTECAGIRNHYQYELALQRPIAKVFAEEAVDGLAEELKRVKLQGEV